MINVSIEATGKCEHCPHMALEMNTENIFTDSKVIERRSFGLDPFPVESKEWKRINQLFEEATAMRKDV